MSDLAAPGYREWLDALKVRVRAAQSRAAAAVHGELSVLYWSIGRDIVQRQAEAGWGTKVIDRLARDLRREFPDMQGFSARNLKYMRAFATAWPEPAFVQEVLAQLTWYHNVALVEKLKDPATRTWYARAAIEHGWSRAVLVLQIESHLHQRQGRATTNFGRTLPPVDSDLAREQLKDPYVFSFLTLEKAARERELELGLLRHVEQFLLELGTGFAFVGRQVKLTVSDQDFFVDLLFYHLKLRCFVVIELKAVPFEPEFAGKLNFYLSVVDDQLRHPSDAPTIGLMLCKSKDRVVAEYALRDMNKPIGVADWQTQIVDTLPEALASSLPRVEDLEAELAATTTDPASMTTEEP